MEDEFAQASTFFKGYFHEDCLLDDPDWQSVVKRFKREGTPETLRSTRGSLLRLISRMDDSAIEEFLFGPSFRCHYDPRADGLTPRQWIEGIVALLPE